MWRNWKTRRKLFLQNNCRRFFQIIFFGECRSGIHGYNWFESNLCPQTFLWAKSLRKRRLWLIRIRKDSRQNLSPNNFSHTEANAESDYINVPKVKADVAFCSSSRRKCGRNCMTSRLSVQNLSLQKTFG